MAMRVTLAAVLTPQPQAAIGADTTFAGGSSMTSPGLNTDAGLEPLFSP